MNDKTNGQLPVDTKQQLELETLMAENERLKLASSEALSAKKEAMAQRAASEQEKLEQTGDYEALYKKSQVANIEAQDKLKSLQGKMDADARHELIRQEVAKHTSGFNVAILTDIVAKGMSHIEGKVVVTGDTAKSLEDYVTAHAQDEKYASLISLSQTAIQAAEGTITRTQFDALPTADKAKNAHLVAKEPVAPTTTTAPLTIGREAFDALPTSEKASVVATHKVVD